MVSSGFTDSASADQRRTGLDSAAAAEVVQVADIEVHRRGLSSRSNGRRDICHEAAAGGAFGTGQRSETRDHAERSAVHHGDRWGARREFCSSQVLIDPLRDRHDRLWPAAARES